MDKFIIKKNDYLLERDVKGYYHQFYTGYKQLNNPDFINVLKNTFNDKNIPSLIHARNKVIEILKRDLLQIVRENNYYNCLCLAVPRAKALNSYATTQLYFKDAISIASKSLIGVNDGTNFIIREKNTYTTHLDKATKDGKVENDGNKPYIGITRDTCRINKNKIKGKNIILIDDIYTKSINIDEDCIQALFDNGAKNIIYYSIGYTRRL